MTQDNLVCWKCGGSLEEIPLPLSRRAECPDCGAELHVCRMCRFYDTTVANQCREPVAEPVQDKTRANFCGYLEPRSGAWQPADRTGASEAEQGLDALFGGGEGERKDPDPADPLSQLESLFGDSTKKP
ncbi:MAG: hypothetical protein PVG91_11550 [Gammaproteobacteria bacterium]